MPIDMHIVQKGKEELEVTKIVDTTTGKELRKVSDYVVSADEANQLATCLVPIIKKWYQDPKNMQSYVEHLEVEVAKGNNEAS